MSYRNNLYSPASQRNGVVIPIDFKFKCRHCSVYKTQDCYSKNEIAPYKHQLSTTPGMKPNAISPLLRCRGCKGEQHQELECQGPCGQVKVLDQFSKAQRSRGNKWCMECVQWKEGHQPEVDMTLAPGSEPAPQAAMDATPVETTGSSYAASMAALSQQASSLAIGTAPGSSQLAPHLRNVAGSGIENVSQSSVSNPYDAGHNEGSNHWTTRDMRRRNGAPMLYNAYDSNGVHHIQEKAMTMTSVATSTAGESRATSVATNSTSRPAASANRPAAGPSRPAAPAASPQPIRVITNQRTGWAKPVGQRTKQPANPGQVTDWAPACTTTYRRSRYDSSDDEM